jgi:hypothetical protein
MVPGEADTTGPPGSPWQESNPPSLWPAIRIDAGQKVVQLVVAGDVDADVLLHNAYHFDILATGFT